MAKGKTRGKRRGGSNRGRRTTKGKLKVIGEECNVRECIEVAWKQYLKVRKRRSGTGKSKRAVGEEEEGKEEK